MECRGLQFQDYFQLIENNLIKYRITRFITKSKTGVPPRQSGAAGNNPLRGTEPPRQGDSLPVANHASHERLSYSRINYDYHISGQIARSTIYSSGVAGNNALRRTDYNYLKHAPDYEVS